MWRTCKSLEHEVAMLQCYLQFHSAAHHCNSLWLRNILFNPDFIKIVSRSVQVYIPVWRLLFTSGSFTLAYFSFPFTYNGYKAINCTKHYIKIVRFYAALTCPHQNVDLKKMYLCILINVHKLLLYCLERWREIFFETERHERLSPLSIGQTPCKSIVVGVV